jgi:hypothetical protein
MSVMRPLPIIPTMIGKAVHNYRPIIKPSMMSVAWANSAEYPIVDRHDFNACNQVKTISIEFVFVGVRHV